MTRIKCIVSYDGSNFSGFQVQDNLRTVQGEIQKALYKILQEDIKIHASGRTDALVHANGQVFHFDTNKDIAEDKWQRAINHFLPADIHIIKAEFVNNDFHSRYQAKTKEYIYKLNVGRYEPTQRNYIFQYNRFLDVELMNQAARMFLGTHDFASFCAYDGLGTTIRTIEEFTVSQIDNLLIFRIRGNGFRRYMVRHMVGGLIQVGAKRISPDRLMFFLESKGKNKCLFKAKPQGLYLNEVKYDEE